MIPARTTDLIGHAETMGLRVIWAADMPERGRYWPGPGIIALRHGMTEARTVSTLAHEIAHAYYGDWCADERTEARAWRYAAQMLISPLDYARAERLDPSPGAIARELGVTTDLVHAFTRARPYRAA